MCQLLCRPHARESFDQLAKVGDHQCLTRLLRMANEDNLEKGESLNAVLRNVADWISDAELKGIRKYRIGRHRFYVQGRNTDCLYTVIFVLINKKDADDKPERKDFQNKLKAALSKLPVIPLDE